MMTRIHPTTLRVLQTIVFATALLLSSPLTGLVDNAFRELSRAQKGDIEITLTDGANRTVIFKS